MQIKYDEEPPSAIKKPPTTGYKYDPPQGYLASENPTFPSKLYEAAEEILIVKTPSTVKSDPSDYLPPKGYNPDINPTFPQKHYKAPKKKVKGKKADGYNPPSGYDYKAPEGYNAEINPTFPQSKYEAPKIDGYRAPDGYDYKPPDGYNPSDNPTFPEKKYLPPHASTTPAPGYLPPSGYDYKAPQGYDANINPTFPKDHYLPPTQKPDHGYIPPDGYDYSPPKGYEADENPTFPKHHKNPNKKYLPPKAHEISSLPKTGYSTPDGYDYSAPEGYSADVNPTFPHKKTKHHPPALNTGYEPPVSKMKELLETLEAVYGPPTKELIHQELKSLYSPPKPSIKLEPEYGPPPPPETSYKPPPATDYKPPPESSYKPPPSSSYKPPLATDYKPPVATDYGAPSKEQVHVDEEYGPPVTEHHLDITYEPDQSTQAYLPPSLTSLPRNYPKHKFNIIIKNRHKPDTSISITPEPPHLTLNHGVEKVNCKDSSSTCYLLMSFKFPFIWLLATITG